MHFLDRYGGRSYREANSQEVLTEFKPSAPEYKPRLVSKEYIKALCSFESPRLDEVKEKFVSWSSYKEYIVFRREHLHTGDRSYKAVKSAKRGNDVYSWRLKDRFEPFMDLPEVTFFNYKDRSSAHKTRALFVTLTLARAVRLDQAWEGIGKEYNKWISKMRRRYGKIQAIRVWEAHKDGWPHIHAILIYESKEFNAFFYNGTWRVQEKHDLEWDCGFTDVEALSSVRGGISYVVKYLSKLHKVGIHGGIDDTAYGDSNLGGLLSNASTLTLSLMWAFRRRAFGISRGLLDLITSMTNSNVNGANQTVLQVDLEGEPVYRWVLIGFWGGDLGPLWSKELSRAEFFEMRKSGTWSEARHGSG